MMRTTTEGNHLTKRRKDIRILAILLTLAIFGTLAKVVPPARQINKSQVQHQSGDAELPQEVQAPSPAAEPLQTPTATTPEVESLPDAVPAVIEVPQPEAELKSAHIDPIAIGRNVAAARGWTGHEWDALYKLWHNESGWNPAAVNSISGACGIPQALPCNKIPDPNNIHSQLEWGAGYIEKRYGSPSRALAFWNAQYPHWY